MEDKSESGGWGIALLILLIIWGWGSYSGKVDELEECRAETYELQSEVDLLDERIEEAKMYVWDDYESMGYALENLETSY